MHILTVLGIWLLLSFVAAGIHWLIRKRIANKCKHHYQITGSIIMGQRVMLFLECAYCGKYSEVEVWNEKQKIRIEDDDVA